MDQSQSFNLSETVDTIVNALNGVVCHILFDASIHGLLVAAAIALVGLSVSSKKKRLAKPLLLAAAKLATFCGILTVPGFLTLMIAGKLPETGYYTSNSLGFISFWSLVSVWLCGEHINHQWFDANKPKQIKKEVETSSDKSTSKSS